MKSQAKSPANPAPVRRLRYSAIIDRAPLRWPGDARVALWVLPNIEHYPVVFDACMARRWDFMCHGIYYTRYHWNLSEDQERAEIVDCVDSFRRITGRQLAGWLSPALSNTLNTPDLLAEAGIKYYCDWVHDEQPFPMEDTRATSSSA